MGRFGLYTFTKQAAEEEESRLWKTKKREQGVAGLWWEDIDIASVITASGPTPTHMCRRRGTPCDTNIHR